MEKRRISVLPIVFAIGAIIMTMYACDAPFGLGGQVDLNAPEVTITSPSRNAYVRGGITVTGTVADDIGMKSVDVVLSTKAGATIGTYPAVLSGSTYTVTIPNDGSVNGEMVIEAVGTDSSNKSTKTSISLFLDNVAPTVLVTSPVNTNSIMTDYIDLKGEVYDTSPIADVTVTLLEADGVTELTTPKRADGTNTWTVRFPLKGQIPALPASGTEAYLINVTVTDTAGNVNTWYYHRADIIAIMTAGATFPAMDAVGKCEQNAIDIADAGITVAELQGKRRDNTIANNPFAGFTYEAEPQIDFTFLNIVEDDNATTNTLAPPTSILGTIVPPLGSGAAIDAASIEVRVYEMDGTTLVATINSVTNAANLIATGIGDSVSFNIKLNFAGVDLAPRAYKFTVYAETDTGGVSKLSNMQEFTIDAESPTFNETTITPLVLFKNAAFEMSFDASHSTDLNRIEIFESFNGAAFNLTADRTINIPDGNTSISGTLSGSLPIDAASDGLYNYRCVIYTDGGKSTTILRSITYDDTDPNLELNSLAPVSLVADTYNGTVTLNVSAQDANGLQSVRYWILPSASGAPSWGTAGSFEWLTPPYTRAVDTSSLGFADGSAVKLWLMARDKAGNEVASVAYPFTIDQSTDRPTVTLTSLDDSIILEASVDVSHNLLQTGGKIEGSISDDDGVASATLELDLDRNGTFDGGVEAINLTLSGTGKTKTFSYAVSSLAQNTYKFRIDALDTNGTPVHSAAMTPVWFAYDTSVPTVVFNPNATDANPVGPYRNANFTVQGTVQDASGITATEISLDNGSTWIDLGITATAGENKAWTHAITAATNNGAKQLVLRATDRFGRTSQNTAVAVTIDSVAPTASIDAFGGGYFADTQLAVSGTASDATSGVKEMHYMVDADRQGDQDESWNLLTGTTDWFKNDISAAALSEGTGMTVWIRATDMAGNTYVTSSTFTVDHNAPAIVVDASYDGAVFKNAAFTIFGTVTDTNLGATPIAITAKKDGVAHTLTNPLTNGSPWSRLINIAGSGVYEVTITATDSVGRSSTATRTITVDVTPPTASISSFTRYATGSKVNGTVTFTALSADANGILGEKYFVTDNAVAPSYDAVVGGNVIAIPGTTSVDTTTLSNGVTYWLWVVARDKAGNDAANATPLSFEVDQTTDIPIVTLTSLSPSITAEVSVDKDHNLLVSGGKISGSIVDDDGVASATLEIDLDRNGTFDGGAEAVSLTLAGFGTTRTFDYAVSSLSENTYKFRIDALDTNGTPIHSAAMTPVWFAYDTSVPSVVFNANATDANPVGPYRIADFTVEGTVQDASGITKTEISLDGGSTWIDLGITEATGAAKAWSHAITAATNNGAKQLVLRATDRYGRTNQNSAVAVTIDTVAPTVTQANFSPTYYADVQLAISGTASDATSGLSIVEYCVDVDGDSNPDDGWYAVTGTSSWYKNDILAGALAEGTRRVWTRGSDQAGNVSTPAEKTFTVDHGAPVIAVDSSFDGTVFVNAAFTIFGTASDGSLGASPISITAKKDGAAHTLTEPITNGASWSRLINISGTGIYEITVTATDTFGRASTAVRTITVDVTPPSAVISSVLPILSGAQVNGIITLSAAASDANGLTGVKWFLRSDASTPAYTDATAAPTGGTFGAAPYTAVIDTTAPGITNNTAYTLWVVARDRAGNDFLTSTSINVAQSSDVPTGAIDSPADTDTIGADKKIRGTFSDDDGVAANGAVLYVRKLGAPTYTSKPISTSSSAGQLVAWTVDVADVLTAGGDGTYQLYFSVTDDGTKKSGLPAANITTAVQTFAYDQNPPTVSAVGAAPSQAAYKASDVLTLSWTASDMSGLASQVVDVDGASTGLGAINTASAPDYSVVYTVPSSGLTSGNKTFTLVVTDNTGRSTTKTLTFLVDVDAPTVDNAFTLDPAFIGFDPNGTFSLKGIASDNRALSGVEIRLSNDNATWSGWLAATLNSGNWSYSVNSATYVPAAGTLYFEVRATDTAGNVSAVRAFSQAVDQADDKASATIINPVTGSTNGLTVQLSGTAKDDDNLADIDNNGVLDPTSIEVEYDTVPTTGATTVNPTITGTGKNATWNYSASLAAGSWTMRVRVKDDNDLWGDWTSPVTFTVDAGVPALTVTTDFTSIVYTNNASLVINGTASDSGGLQYVHARINGGAWVLATAAGMIDANLDGIWDSLATGTVNWQINLNLGSDGLKTIEIAASDNVGGIASVQRSTTLDATPPAGTFDALFRDDPSGSYISTDALNKVVRITGTVTEMNLRDTDPIEISIDGGAWTPVTGTFVWSYVWNTSALADGTYSLQLRITDKAGNVTSSITKNVTTDQDADVPQITQAFVAAPTSGDASNNVLTTLLKVSGTISDDDGFTSGAVDIYLDGSPTPIAATNSAGTTSAWDYTWASLAQGEHFLTLEVTDRNGAVETLGPTYFIVDNANPVLELNAPIAGAKVKAGNLSIAGTATDSGGFGATPVDLTLRHSNPLSNLHNDHYMLGLTGANFSQSIVIDSGSLDGTLFIDVILTDRSGKQASITRAVTIDTTAPSLNLGYPSVGAYINGLVSITGTADDANGLADVTMELLDPADLDLVKATVTRSGTTLSSWEFPFNAASYASATYAYNFNGLGTLWKIWFKMAALDNSGNETILRPNAVAASAVSTVTGEITLPSSVVTELVINEPVHVAATTMPTGFSASMTYYVKAKPTATTITLSTIEGGATVIPSTAGSAVTVRPDWPSFYIDTDGDKPTIAVTQPKNGDKIGGFVSMFGTATDDDGPVMQVEVQIDFNGNSNFTDTRDINNNDGNGNPADGIELGVDTDILGRIVRIGNATYKWEDEAAWYVVPVTNNSWTIELNSYGELYASNTGGTGDIIIRVRSRDQFGLPSEISTRTITLDQTFPRIENVTPSDQSYQSGIFTLNADFGDNIDLDLGANSEIRIAVNKGVPATIAEGASSGNGWDATLTADLAEPQNGYDLALDLDSNYFFNNSSGILYLDLYVRDESNYTNQKSYTFYIDNQAPTGNWSTRLGAPDGLSTRNGQIAINGTVNYAFIEGDYLDSGSVSGIDRIEVYFTAPTLVTAGSFVIGNYYTIKSIGTTDYTLIGGTNTVGVEFQATGAGSGTGTAYASETGTLQSLRSANPANDKADTVLASSPLDVYSESGGTWSQVNRSLPVETFEGRRQTVNAGSFVVGRTYTIKTVGTTSFTSVGASSNTIGVRFTATGTGSGTGDAYDETANEWVLRIDRPTEMSSISTGADADGDGFYEFMGIDAGAQRWRAYFDSQYLPDGLIDIHYVVYDLAGNTVHKVRRGFISNFGPSISRIRVGSDYNGTGTVVDVSGSVTEILDYYWPAATPTPIDRYSASLPVKIKNGKLYFNVQSSDPNGTIASTVINIVAPSPGSRGLLTSFGGASGGNVANNPLAPISVTVPSAQFPSAGDYTLEVVVKDDSNIPTKQTIVIRVLNTVDIEPPVVTPIELTQDNGVPTSGSAKLGHLELMDDYDPADWDDLNDYYGDDNDPKVSGAINLRGTITDNERIESLDITVDGIPANTEIANWDGTQLVTAAPGVFTIVSQALTEDGHTVTFVYQWDTSTITGVAALDRTVAFRAADAAALNSAAHGALRYDVVPYITGIQRNPALFNTYRSRLGGYGVRQGESLQFTGFNIYNSASDTITLSNTSGTTTAFSMPASGTASAFTLASLDATASSGPVTLTVNGRISINNINDDGQDYNKEATPAAAFDGSALWTDDRSIHVWRSDDSQGASNRGYFTGSADPEYPSMTINASGLLYGSWSNYADSDILYGPNNGASTVIFHGYDPSEHTDIHFGSRATVAFNANLYGNGAWDVTGAGGTYIWDSRATQGYTGTPTGGVYNAEALYHDQKLMQFTNQRVVTSGNNIHVSYYDTDTKALKYYYRTSGDNTYYTQSWINVDGGSDAHDTYNPTNYFAINAGFETGALDGWIVTAGTVAAVNNNGDTGGWSARLDDATGTTDPRMEMTLTGLRPSTTYNVTIRAKSNNASVTVYAGVTGHGGAGGAEVNRANTAYGTLTVNFTTGAANTTAVLHVRATNSNATTRFGYVDNLAISAAVAQVLVTNGTRTTAAGEFSAIDVTPTNGFPVIAYYDITNKTVKLARASAVNPTPTQWTLQTVMDVADSNYLYSGKYISMKIDSAGYVHLVFFRNSTGDLIYMRSTNHPTDGSTDYTFDDSVIIDSIGSVGVWADITLRGDWPYVSYLDSSMVNTFDGIKMAYYNPALESETGDVADIPDTVDGWETMNAALAYEVENVRTSVETDTGTNFWQQAIGYSSSDFFRIAYYVKQ
jgi:hypothetical protein